MNWNIQGLRAFAAYAVVVNHVLFMLNDHIAHLNVHVNAGATGVDVFFVISGFIMAATSSGRPIRPGEFISHRIIRIVPIYWLLTLVKTGFVILGFKLFNSTFDMAQLLRSLFFISDPNERPVIFVGWTLNYEMMFYGIFAVCLFIPKQPVRLAAICGSIVLLWAVGLGFPDGSYISYISRSIILEFACGIVLWAVSRKYSTPTPASALLIVLGLCGLALPDLVPTLPSPTLVVAPAACALVFAAISLEARGHSVGNGIARRQGDASYSIYLLHLFVLEGIGKLAIVMGLTASSVGLCVTVAVMLIAVAAISTLFYLAVERPLTRHLRRWAGIGSVPVAVPATKRALPAVS